MEAEREGQDERSADHGAFDEGDRRRRHEGAGASAEGRGLLKDIDAYKIEYGNKSMWAHEYIYPTWRENPTPIVEGLRGYLTSDYDYEKDVRAAAREPRRRDRGDVGRSCRDEYAAGGSRQAAARRSISR